MDSFSSADHVREAQERHLAIIRAMARTERLRQAFRMNQRMRVLLAEGFRQRHPEWSEVDIRRAVAERILYARTG